MLWTGAAEVRVRVWWMWMRGMALLLLWWWGAAAGFVSLDGRSLGIALGGAMVGANVQGGGCVALVVGFSR